MWTLKSSQHKQWPKIKNKRLKKSLTKKIKKMFRKKYEKFENKIEKRARARLSACRSVCLPKLAQDNPSYPKQVPKVTKKPLKTQKHLYV
jgi:hypothetical protein